MRWMWAALFLLAVAWGEPASTGSEPDAAVAEPGRWVEARGCASGSFRSRALPVVTEIEEAWYLHFDSIEAPPVHWDGTGYVVARVGGKPTLVAFDLRTGKERARFVLRGFLASSTLLVWDHLVLLQPDDQQITGYRLDGKRLEISWIFRGGGARPRDPVIHDNELYCFLDDDLARIRPGANTPTWRVPARRGAGRPAVYGPYLFLAAFDTPFEAESPFGGTQMVADLHLDVHRRTDGREATSRKLCQAKAERGGERLDVMVAGPSVYIGSNWPLLAVDGTASHCIVPLKIGGDALSLEGRAGLWDCRVPPAHQPRLGTLLLSPPRGSSGDRLEWCVDRAGSIYKLAAEAEQPDVFHDRVTPTVLGDIVYFGSWAADMETGEILWRLPVAGKVSYPAVPADRLVLIVEGSSLRAFRGRGKQ